MSTLTLANLMSNNDPLSKRARPGIRVDNTVWNSDWGGHLHLPRLLSGENRIKQWPADNCAWFTQKKGFGYHFINQYPDILACNQAQVTVKKKDSVNLCYLQLFIARPNYALKECGWFWNWFKPSLELSTTMRPSNRGNQRLIAVIMGVGDWADRWGILPSPIWRALIEKAKITGYKNCWMQVSRRLTLRPYTWKPFYATVKRC